MKVIGISGKAGHGKDTLGDVLRDTFGLRRAAFADQLKRDAYYALIEVKDSPVIRVWETGAKLPPIDFINSIKHLPEVRAFLQSFGQVQRLFEQDYWVRRLFDKVEADARAAFINDLPFTGVAITDVRYPNEADYIRTHGGIVVRIERPDYDNGLSPEAQAHDSETALDGYDFDTHLFNDGEKQDLFAEVADNLTIQRYMRRG